MERKSASVWCFLDSSSMQVVICVKNRFASDLIKQNVPTWLVHWARIKTKFRTVLSLNFVACLFSCLWHANERILKRFWISASDNWFENYKLTIRGLYSQPDWYICMWLLSWKFKTIGCRNECPVPTRSLKRGTRRGLLPYQKWRATVDQTIFANTNCEACLSRLAPTIAEKRRP